MLSCLLLIRAQRAWFSGAAGWKRCLVCDKSNLGLWFIKCLQNNNRKANGSTQGAPEFCRGKKYSAYAERCHRVHVLLVCCWYTLLWKCNIKCCFWQRIVKCEPVLKRIHLSGWVFPCTSECALLGKKAALRICSQDFSCVTHLPPSPFEISCVCLYVYYLVQFPWPSIVVSQGNAWSHGFLTVLQHLLSGTMACQNSQQNFFCFVVRTDATVMRKLVKAMGGFTWNVAAQLIPILPCLIGQRMLPSFSVPAEMCLYMRSLNFHSLCFIHRWWHACTLL